MNAGALHRGEAGRALTCGIDTLVLALSLRWKDDRALRQLAEIKQRAKARGDEEPLTLSIESNGTTERFRVKPHGKQGAEWLLVGTDLAVALSKQAAPSQRPSAMVEVRSEALWTHGADAMVARVVGLFEAMGAAVEAVKPSRVDLCVDVLLRAAVWREDLKRHLVTRARYVGTHESNRVLSGFSIGRGGAVSARLYDKPREIREQSGKDWMFQVWKLPSVPEGHVIVRVEFQLRRDVLRETRARTWADTGPRLTRMWCYCSTRWLRAVRDASVHHTMQRALPWWRAVEHGFTGAQRAWPIVREKALNRDRRRLAAQSVGTLGSIAAMGLAPNETTADTLDMRSFLHDALDEALGAAPMEDAEFARRFGLKRAKYGRAEPAGGEKMVPRGRVALESARDAPEDSA